MNKTRLLNEQETIERSRMISPILRGIGCPDHLDFRNGRTCRPWSVGGRQSL